MIKEAYMIISPSSLYMMVFITIEVFLFQLVRNINRSENFTIGILQNLRHCSIIIKIKKDEYFRSLKISAQEIASKSIFYTAQFILNKKDYQITKPEDKDKECFFL